MSDQSPRPSGNGKEAAIVFLKLAAFLVALAVFGLLIYALTRALHYK